jgi:hypothetical protein
MSAAEDAEFLKGIAEERRRSRLAARALVDAARSADVEQFLSAIGWVSMELDAWRLAMRGISRLGAVSAEIHDAFLNVWIQHKHLPLAVGDRPTMAKAARVLFPGYVGPPLRLYRGTCRRERARRLYGFSWTTQRDIAQRFGDQHSHVAERMAPRSTALDVGIVLETVASPSAILLLREQEGFYDEGEVVVDPYRLGAVTLAGQPASPPRTRDDPEADA